MRLARLFAMTLLLCAVIPVPAQEDEANVYFSLASNQTYSASEKPQVQLWTQGVQTLQFRLYRVNNAIRFFQNLQDTHTMGEPPRRTTSTAKKTPLEQFHAMKRAWRTRLRNVVRAQYTAENRASIRTASNTPSAQTGPEVDNYAQVPVLNPQQLVSTWQVNVSTAHRWENQLVPVATPGNGVYVVEATNGKLRAFTILQVSDLVVIVKGAAGRLVTQVVNRSTGDPVADAALVVWSGKKDLGRGTTDIDGMATFSFTEAQLEHVLVMAKKAEDFVANAVYGYSLNANNGGQWMGYVYTDRPVYRPRHQVHFRAVIRSLLGSGYRIPAVSDVDIEVQDNESKPVYRTKGKLSPFGTVSGDFDLPATASLGYYSVQVKNGQSMAAGGFEVQEYKKPEYEVRVNPDKPRVLQGEPIKATIVARYYFGEPVANAKVTWVVHKARYWSPLYAEEEYGEEGDGEGGDEGGYYGGEQVAQDAGQTDADGKLAITFPNSVEKNDLIYRIEARVTDAANREIAGSSAVVATVGTFLINVQPDQYVYAPGAPASLQVETRDYDGKATQADFTVSIHEWRWQGGQGREVASGTGHTDTQGKAHFDFKAPPGGSYQAKVTAVTPERREISDSTYLWISGGGDFWSSGRNQRLQIVPDKKSYAAGDKAKVLLVTGQPKATLLVSIEGRDPYSTRVIRADSPTVTINIPIDATQEPNFFVSASYIKDGKQFQGMKSINVPPVDHKINVDLKPSKQVYKPGEAATYTIDARDNTGKPAAAEFSLGVVDEAIYAIRREMAPEILNFFYGRGWNRVNTSNSLTYYFQGQAGKRALQLARVKRHTLAQFKPEKLVDAKIRKAFPDTSFWDASLRTNAAGHAEAKLEFPDALTTWRATARGITADSRVGSAVSRVIVRKNLILRLSTPRFFRDGDEVTISALVHNYLATEKTARVSLTAQGADIIDGGTKDVSIPSKGEAHVDYRLRAKPGATVILVGKALTDEESDGLELTLPVIPFGVKLSEARSGSISEATGNGGAVLTFPAQSAPTSRTLLIEATPSMAGAIFGALEYLTGFPYGCVEQTMSSFLPNVIVSKAAKDLKLKSNLDEAELGKKIRAGLDRLYDFQHEDGGWGWWKTDESHPFMTPYVVAGLLEGRAAGSAVRQDVIDRGAAWLRTEVQKGKANPDQRAYMAYALALGGPVDKAFLDGLWNDQSKMTNYGVALYGLALHLSKDARAPQVATALESAVKDSPLEAWWPANRDNLLDFTADATPEATAFAMKLLTTLRPDSPLLPKAAAWLVNNRNGGYYWNTTKQTAMVIFGITDYLKISRELTPNFSYTVTVNGQQVAAKRFTQADALAPTPASIRIPAEQLKDGKMEIRVTKTGEGRLYWSARAEYFSTEDRISRTGDTSFSLEREYFRVTPVRQGEKIIHRLDSFNGNAVPGEVLAVHLKLQGAGLRYLIIEDPIPAGAEFIERDDLYELSEKPKWWGYWYTRREFHDDRAALFQTYPSTGVSEFTYLIKVVNPGRFRVSPATAQPMYQPGLITTTESRTMEVR